ncbi:MAG: sensor histidine kinase [Alphaproteobacteria bacterium]|nr:MAG: sensor histidine kinase [Alphaproteobacteria bacterium]
MLREDEAAGPVMGLPVAYMVYSHEGRLLMCSDRVFDFFPPFRDLDLIGLHRSDIRRLLRENLGARGGEVDKLDAVSKAGRLSSSLGIFELGGGNFFALDDLPLPDGGTLTLIRDMTEKKHDHDLVTRLEAALSRLAKEEAIYSGANKTEAYRILTEIACKALGAARTDVWLMNVDRTALYPQESYWAPAGGWQELERLDRADEPDLFELVDGGTAISAAHLAAMPALAGLAAQSAGTALTSMLVTPICRGPRAIGAVVVAVAGTGRIWGQSEMSFVSYLADLILRMLDAHDRQVAEEGLRNFNEMLETRVKSRTTELEQAMDSLKLAQEELVRSEKMASLGGLVAGVAHEINTPLGVALTSITHMGDAVRQFETLVESGRIRRSDLSDFLETSVEATTVIRRNLERAAHLVRSFKMVAVDQAMDDARELDVTEYLGEIVDSLKPTLRKQGVVVDCLPADRLMMRTVAGDLSHVLTNLIMNAALHAFRDAPDKPDKKVVVSAVRAGDQILLEVSDNGRGIPEGIRSRIFEPFFTTARDKGGSGLGLNIVYNTVYQKMKGSIEVDDAPGGGARFRISLPA